MQNSKYFVTAALLLIGSESHAQLQSEIFVAGRGFGRTDELAKSKERGK